MSEANIYTGLDEYVAGGTSGGTMYSLGLVTGGTLQTGEQTVHQRGGVRGDYASRGGLVQPGGDVEFLPQYDATSPSVTFMGYAQRAIGGAWPDDYPRSALTAIGIEAATKGVKHTWSAGKINTLRLSCALDEALQAAINFLARSYVEGAATSAPAVLDGPHWEWYEAAVLIAGGAYVITSWSAELNNNLTVRTDQDGPTPNQARWPKAIIEGDEEIRVEVEMDKHMPIATLGTLLDEATGTHELRVACTTETGGKLLYVWGPQLTATGKPIPIVQGGEVISYRIAFESVRNARTAAFVAATQPWT
jgi:hypothetical protein